MFGLCTVTKSTYRRLLNRVAEKLYGRNAARWEKVESWLLARLKAAHGGKPNRQRFVSERPQALEDKGLFAGQVVSHRHGGRAVVLQDDAPAGWVWVRESTDSADARTMWRLSETRTRKGTGLARLAIA